MCSFSWLAFVKVTCHLENFSRSHRVAPHRITHLAVQLCDFGLARSLGKAAAGASPGGSGVAPDVEDGDGGGEAKLTEYVVTRWWRAPEVSVQGKGYCSLR